MNGGRDRRPAGTRKRDVCPHGESKIRVSSQLGPEETSMPKVLTDAQVRSYERDGYLSPVRALSAARGPQSRAKFEALEARVPDIKKMKTKSHLLCPWVLEIAE